MDIQATNKYGRIPGDFTVSLPKSGYVALVGANNSGKSTLLQFLFKRLYETTEIGPDSIAFLSPERTYIHPSNETNGNNLQQWNRQFYEQSGIAQGPIQYDASRGPDRGELARLLNMHGGDFHEQYLAINEYLGELGFDRYKHGNSLHIEFKKNGRVDTVGTGLRSVLAILSALTDENLQAILIDEPELYLEPKVQKLLRDLLIAQAGDRLIIVSTHSHLFLNRVEPSRNWVVGSIEEKVDYREVASEEELYGITFQLLGNNTKDLFFPGNYLIVEGGSDEVILSAVSRHLGVSSADVKIIAAGGDARSKNALSAVEDSLKPLIFANSPYKDRVVVLVDKPNKEPSALLGKLKAKLDEDRLFVLKEESLEEQLPEEVYLAAGLDRSNELEKLENAANREERDLIKTNISNKIAQQLTAEHIELEAFNEMKLALKQATKL